MAPRVYNVLFLCTGNSARSIIAEALLNAESHGKFRAYSAGSSPKSGIHPLTLQILEQSTVPTEGLHSKSWDQFAKTDAPEMDFVFTVSDEAAGENTPVWPGQPITAHWSTPDPAKVQGDDVEKMRAFRETLRMLSNRIRLFANLPFEKLDRIAIKHSVDTIGQDQPAEA